MAEDARRLGRRSGEAFVAIRAIAPSPFGDAHLYYGGYDGNFSPADGTTWIATSTLTGLHPDDRKMVHS